MADRLPSRSALLTLTHRLPIHVAAREDVDTLQLGYDAGGAVFLAPNTREPPASGDWSATATIRPWSATGVRR